MSMAIQIKLENFEGPLDHTIHLVEKNKMDITKIDIFPDYRRLFNVYKGSTGAES